MNRKDLSASQGQVSLGKEVSVNRLWLWGDALNR
jgi:hypothetical protein